MAPKRSTKVVVTKKVVQETVQVSITRDKKKGNKDITDDHQVETTSLKTFAIEDNEQEEDEQQEENGEVAALKGEPETETRKATKEKKKKTQKGLETQKKINKKRKRSASRGTGENYKLYVFKVLKQVHPDMSISGKAMTIMNNLMNDMFERLVNEAAELCKHRKVMTLTSWDMHEAVKLVLPGEIGRHAITEGTKAVSKYSSYDAT